MKSAIPDLADTGSRAVRIDPVMPSIDDIVQAIAAVAGPGAALHEPEIGGNAQKYVAECLDTGWVSTAGAYVEKFEQMLADFTGVPHAIAMINGTAALHVALMLAGVESGDEVVMPSLTFVATANAAAYIGATPHFADIEMRTLGVDPRKLADHLARISEQADGACINRETGRRIAAIVCMHTYGHPVDLDALSEVAGNFGLTLVEDAAESLGSYYKGRHTGSVGRLATLSFNGNKIATSGGGGAIVTSDPDLAERARHLTNTAKKKHPFEFDHDLIGYNYRLPNICAALGCAQLEGLASALDRKRHLADKYREAFASLAGAEFFGEPEDCRSNYWLNTILVDHGDLDLRNAILERTNQMGLSTRPAWMPMHKLEMYRSSPKMDLSVTEDVYRRLICLPSSPQLIDG
jgi:perosamine synthetase